MSTHTPRPARARAQRTRPARPLTATLAVLLTAALLLAAGLLCPAPAGAATGQCETSSPVTGLTADAHPVVLVHGWRGEPMQPLRHDLEQLMPTGWQYLLFNYHQASDEWAASDNVSGCLVDYLWSVINHHPGDKRIYVVGHSMGGLALRFAVARDPQLAAHIAGLITLDTPHTGSPWGNSGFYAGLMDALGKMQGLGDIPPANIRASRCLAVHTADSGMPSGCAAVPYLPASIPVHQIASVVTLHRRLFGLLAYQMTVGGDGIVGIGSSGGYLGSAAGPTVGRTVSTTQVGCTQDMMAIEGMAVAGYQLLRGQPLKAALAPLHMEGNMLDAVMAGRTDPGLAEILLWTTFMTPCGHTNMPSMAETVDDVAHTLKTMATPQPVTRGQMLAMHLPDQHTCTHPDPAFAGATLVDGKLESSQGFITVSSVTLADLDGDGVGDGVAVLSCGSGHGGTSEAIMYRTAASPDVVELPYSQDAKTALHGALAVDRVTGVRISGGHLLVDAGGLGPTASEADPPVPVELVYDLGPGGPKFHSATDTTAGAPSSSAGAAPNKTGPATIPDRLGGACGAFTLTSARQVVPDLPDQQMDLGDANCSYQDPPDANNRANGVTFVRPHLDQPGWVTQDRSGQGQSTPAAVGDGGFCLDEGGGAFEFGWQRGSTGLELDASGPGVTCAKLNALARTLNASL